MAVEAMERLVAMVEAAAAAVTRVINNCLHT